MRRVCMPSQVGSEMANIGRVDARELEGRKDGENRPSIQSRDFFWDSVTLFVVGAILALSALDYISEYVRGSEVQCFFNDSAVGETVKNLENYINEKCSASLPPAEYLPVFIAVHAILIFAPHYVWLNLFGAKLDSFFHLVSGLVRIREPTTGDYPESNYLISKQLDVFCSGINRANSMYQLYLLKLLCQIFVSVGGFILVMLRFRDFDETFTCPANDVKTLNYDWPLTGETVTCVFTSLRLLHNIWLINLVLLLVSIICLTLAFIWLLTDHTKELGLDKVVAFSFQTSLPFHHYTPQLTLFRKLSGLPQTLHSLLSFFPFYSIGSNGSYHIRSDYDFLLVKLFRTDGGLAQVLREVHLLRQLREENNVELARVSSHRTVADFTDEEKSAFVDTKFLNAELGWKNLKNAKQHFEVDEDTPLLLPLTLRGVVLGLSARCTGSKIEPPPPRLQEKLLCGALCIVFDSESIGFAGALARVFQRVAVLNFSKTYSDYENPARENINNSLILSMTVPHDILMTEHVIETHVDTGDDNVKAIIRKRAVTRFYDDLADEIWRPGYIYNKRQEEIRAAKGEPLTGAHRKLTHYRTDYIVIGPVSTNQQRATVNMFVRKKKSHMSRKVVLLTIEPLEISGVKVDKSCFPPFRPFGFKELLYTAPDPNDVNAFVQTHPNLNIYSWPQSSISTSEVAELTRNIRSTAVKDWLVKTGDTKSKFRFSLFIKTEPSTSATTCSTTLNQAGANQSKTTTTGSQSAATKGQTATTEGQTTVSACQSAITGNQSATTSGQAAAIADQSATTGGQTATTSGETTTTTGQSATTGGQIATTSGQTATTGGQIATTTGQSATTGGQIATTTGQSATTGGQIATTSGQTATTGDKTAGKEGQAHGALQQSDTGSDV